MTALALGLAVFALWSVLGWGLVSLVRSRRDLLGNALLSPVAGVAALLLVVFELSQAGLPVSVGGPIATGALLGLALFSFVRRPTPVPVRRLLPFGAVLAAAALVTGFPFLLHGFDWVSFCNDDMANYVLSAKAFLHHGALAPVDPAGAVENREPGILFWLDLSLMGARCGSELLLAWLESVSPRSGHQLFMPAMLALHLVLLTSAGALAGRCLRGRLRARAALVATSLLAASALTTLGTVYQLISQVLGLSLLAGASVLLLRPAVPYRRSALLREALLPGILVAGLGFGYPEVLPFLVLGAALFHARALLAKEERWRPAAAKLAAASGIALVLLHLFSASTAAYLTNQATKGSLPGQAATSHFPYFLLPTGPGILWGFLNLSTATIQPFRDPLIAFGCLLLAGAAIAAARGAWRGGAAATIAAVMLALGARLFATNTDFGLFKLAMFVQPFLLASVAPGLSRAAAERASGGRRFAARAGGAVVALAALLGIRTQVEYVRASADVAGAQGAFSEIPAASRSRLVSRLRELAATPREDVLVSDSANVVLAKFEGLYFAPSSLRIPSKDFFGVKGPTFWPPLVTSSVEVLRPGAVRRAADIFRARERWFTRREFDMLDGRRNPFFLERDPGAAGPETRVTLLASGTDLTVVNRRRSRGPAPLDLVPADGLRNHLVLLDSKLGVNYYQGGTARTAGKVALYQPEPDPLFRGRTMSAVGRTLLFKVLGPRPPLRLALDFTATIGSGGGREVPPVSAIGTTRVLFPVRGRGSARLFSPPLSPQLIDGEAYVALDLGRDGTRFPDVRTGLMRLWGRAVPTDTRRINGFARDLSAVTLAEYDAMEAPTALAKFPADLANPALEYSGIYEDGWVGGTSLFRLRQPARSSALVVRVAVPDRAGIASHLALSVDGSPVGGADLRPGANEVRLPFGGAGAPRTVELRFDREASLPAPDGRIVSALLQFVGFEEAADGRTEIADAPIALGDGWYPFERYGGETFRWVQGPARLTLRLAAAEAGLLAIDVESGPGLGSGPFRLVVTVGGRTVPLEAHGGRERLTLPLSLGPGVHEISLAAPGGGRPAPGDPRILNFRLFSVAWHAGS